MSLPLLTPAPRPVWGLETAGAPPRSALTLFDFGLADTIYDVPDFDRPNDVHDAVLETPALSQIDTFLAPDGRIVNPCEGPCDPE